MRLNILDKLRRFRPMTLWTNANGAAVSLAALGVGLTITFVSYQSIQAKEAEASRLRFDRIVSDTARDIVEAMSQYERLLQAAGAHLRSLDRLDRDKWRIFADELHLQERYPGLLGLGYAPVVPASSLAEHLKSIRDEGYPLYRIAPAGERDVYTPISMLEPFIGRNLKAFGFDMYSEQVRRSAMQRAQDSGMPALSGKVRLVQEGADPQLGTLMYLPVYSDGASLLTVEERSAALRGFLVTPFRMPDLMHAALADRVSNVALEVFDGESAVDDARLFSREMDVLQDLPAYSPAYDEAVQLVVGQ